MTPAIIKVFVSMYDNTIKVRMQAIRSDSSSELPDFSPNALAQTRQILRKKILIPLTMPFSKCHV